jgi:glycerol-1-phosphate dehydrogenase [NAD(P)+]
MVSLPETLARALRLAGAPATIEELDPPTPPAVVRWAVRALPLMRNRFTVVDLRFFAGLWSDEDAEALLERSGILGIQQ